MNPSREPQLFNFYPQSEFRQFGGACIHTYPVEPAPLPGVLFIKRLDE